jgi:DNA-binding response OmpR family regulator
MASGRRTILMVDDEPSITEPLAEALSREGWDSAVAQTAAEGLELADRLRPELVLLDVMLPDGSGYDVCRELRRRSEIPIIMLTARGEETDRVVGLEVGADDYVTKPFSPRELALRVDSVLRRAKLPASPRRLVDGDLLVDESRHEAYRDGQVLALTGREFDLLRFLIANPGTAYSRDELLEKVWGWSFGDQSTVTVHVRRLREKVEVDPTRPVRLQTVWGVGYRWEAVSH